MRATLLILVLLAAPALASQTVWKWVDANGVTHYSDRPVAGATRIELNVGSRADPYSPATNPRSSAAQTPVDAGPPYRNFEIWKPGDQETIVNTGGEVTVNVRVDPPLQSEHRLNLYLDGRLVEGPANAAEYTLRDVARGQHTLVAVINDRGGQRIQETSPVVFHQRQTSVAQPAVGPALRRPPKP
jgi:hypothetical protein